MTKPKPHQAACEFCGRQFLRIKFPYCPECRELVAHFVGVVPGADEDAPYFVGRKLYWTEVKEAAPGFLPDGLIVQTYNGRYVVQGGVLVKYQEGAAA